MKSAQISQKNMAETPVMTMAEAAVITELSKKKKIDA